VIWGFFKDKGKIMNIDKFFEWWFTGQCLKNPIVAAVAFFIIGYGVGKL
jgi:hypothetical protein